MKVSIPQRYQYKVLNSSVGYCFPSSNEVTKTSYSPVSSKTLTKRTVTTWANRVFSFQHVVFCKERESQSGYLRLHLSTFVVQRKKRHLSNESRFDDYIGFPQIPVGAYTLNLTGLKQPIRDFASGFAFQ